MIDQRAGDAQDGTNEFAHLLLVGAIAVSGGTGAAPFIYALF